MGSLDIAPQMLVSRVKQELTSHESQVSVLAVKDDCWLMSCSWDGTVQFTDLATWEVKQKLEGAEGPMLGATYLKSRLVTASEGELQFWRRPGDEDEEDEEEGGEAAPVDPKAKGGKAAATDPIGRPPPGEWVDFELEEKVALPVPDYTTQANLKVYGLVASGKQLLTANRDHIMRVWSLVEIAPPAPEVPEGAEEEAAAEGEGEGDKEKDAKAPEPPAEEEVEPPPPVFEWQVTSESVHPEGVTCLLALPDGRVVSGCVDKRVRVWQKMGKDWGVAARLDGHTNAITALASATLDPPAPPAPAEGEEEKKDEAEEEAPPPKEVLLTGSGDGTVRMWDVHGDWACITTFTAPGAGGVKSICQCSPKQIVVGMGDGSLRVWFLGKVAGQEEPGWVCRRTAARADSKGCIYAMCVHGSRLVTGGSDAVMRVYQ